jgi:hypothetical protein
MSGFESSRAVLEYRRKTVPPYRDIRDRPTWELLDTLYWDNRINPDGFVDPANSGLEYINSQISRDGMSGLSLRRMLRIDEAGNRFYDGTRDVSTIYLLFQTNTNSRFQIYHDMRIVGGNNSQHLHCNALASFENPIAALGLFPILPEGLQEIIDDVVRDLPPVDVDNLPIYNMSVTSASGSWTGATNVVVNGAEFDLATLTIPVRIFRALN